MKTKRKTLKSLSDLGSTKLGPEFSTSKGKKRKPKKGLSYATQQLLGFKNTYISNEEWVNMTDEEKTDIREIRSRVKRNKAMQKKEQDMFMQLARFEFCRLGLTIK